MGHYVSRTFSWTRGLLIVLLVLSVVACSSPDGSPRYTPPGPAGDPSALIQGAKTDLDAENYDTAIEKLEQAVGLDAYSTEAHYLLGNAYALKEMFSQAEEQLLEALRIEENHTDARSNLGVVYYRQGKLPEAEKAFRRALQDQPDDAEVHYNLGGVFVALNRTDQAVSEFLRAKELDPSLAEPYLGLGSVYKLQGKNDEAIVELREYIKLTQDATWRDKAREMIRELGGQP